MFALVVLLGIGAGASVWLVVRVIELMKTGG
jgi:hypothetical protein